MSDFVHIISYFINSFTEGDVIVSTFTFLKYIIVLYSDIEYYDKKDACLEAL